MNHTIRQSRALQGLPPVWRAPSGNRRITPRGISLGLWLVVSGSVGIIVAALLASVVR